MMLSTTLAVKTQTTEHIKKTFRLAYEENYQIIKMILTATHQNKVDFDKLLIVFSHSLFFNYSGYSNYLNYLRHQFLRNQTSNAQNFNKLSEC